jgi:hypothetical protein
MAVSDNLVLKTILQHEHFLAIILVVFIKHLLSRTNESPLS